MCNEVLIHEILDNQKSMIKDICKLNREVGEIKSAINTKNTRVGVLISIISVVSGSIITILFGLV